MDAGEIQKALDDVFDQAILFHAFTDYMRDYEIITYAVADPRTGIQPSYDRYVFRHTVEADVATAVSTEVWSRSLDERLIHFDQGKDLSGFVWGVKWQCLYPGGKVIQDSPRARRWATDLGIKFHEVRIETNAQTLSLVFSDLDVSSVPVGYTPFVVAEEDHYIPPTPLK